MCNRSCIAFGERSLVATMVAGREVLEVGALDVNGSLRRWVEAQAPATYVGVDLTAGPGVDEIVDASSLVTHFGRDSFDVVITTEMVEHTRDWQRVVTNLKGVLRPGGHLLVTTRSPGFAYHAWPYDFWRYTTDDMRAIFADLEELVVEPDPQAAGVFVLGRKPESFLERTPNLALTSMITGRREHAVSERQIQVFMLRHRLVSAGASVAAPLGGVARSARRGVRRAVRARNAAWRALPTGARVTVKRALRRA